MKLKKRWTLFALKMIDIVQGWAITEDDHEADKLKLDAAWYKQKIRESAGLDNE